MEKTAEDPQKSDYEVKTLLSWSAPGRPFKKRTRQFYLNALLIAFFVEIILFLFSQYTFMFVVVSILFLGFAFATVPPKSFHYRVSTEGIMIEDHFYIWHELYDFYFKIRQGEDILYVRTQDFFPGALVIPLGDVHKDQIKQILVQYLPYREFVKPTFMDKAGDWLAKNFPLERS